MLKNILIAIILISILTDVFLFFRFRKYIKDHAEEEVDKHKTILLRYISGMMITTVLIGISDMILLWN